MLLLTMTSLNIRWAFRTDHAIEETQQARTRYYSIWTFRISGHEVWAKCSYVRASNCQLIHHCAFFLASLAIPLWRMPRDMLRTYRSATDSGRTEKRNQTRECAQYGVQRGS